MFGQLEIQTLIGLLLLPKICILCIKSEGYMKPIWPRKVEENKIENPYLDRNNARNGNWQRGTHCATAAGGRLSSDSRG